ncbi:hypothetical protein INT47_002656 [Mucor saturninus]|uniref:RING-type E3 ubiquitin transferase n=1 Tax=Mucor saturninus TaxID=64648 RepID=A0A8H7R745_9FUNG|nr:hypothetical protein INT47_002656 [Mucor saturninus]
MSDFEEECDFQAPINVPVDIYTRKRNRCQIEDDKYVETEQDLTEVSTCSLCQTCWTNNGAHGIVGLKCGHVFGRSCIVQHMRDATAQKTPAKCPTCDNPLTKAEPRRIWPNKVIPCDEADLIELKKQHAEADLIIQGLKEANEAIQQQIDKAIFDHLVLQAEDRSNRIISPSQIMQMSQPSIFVHQRSFSKKNEKYRVMDVDPMGDRAVVSVWKEQKYGIRKMNLYDITSTEFIPNHSGIIKDLKYNTENMVLSTGLDKTLKLTSLQSNQVVLSYQLGAPGWSCASSEANPSIVYCGLTSNTVLVFDIRNTKEFVHKLIEPCVPKIFSPIHSIMEVMTEDVPLLLCSNLSHTYGWNTSTEEYEYVPLQQSVEYENDVTDLIILFQPI